LLPSSSLAWSTSINTLVVHDKSKDTFSVFSKNTIVFSPFVLVHSINALPGHISAVAPLHIILNHSLIH
jgi:hypothetical protein